MLAVGRDADPAIAEFVYELFTAHPARRAAAAGPGRWSTRWAAQHIALQNLTVPTLVIGSEKDRLLPMISSRQHRRGRRRTWPEFVELPGGHCAILERPDEVNGQLRAAGRVGQRHAASASS